MSTPDLSLSHARDLVALITQDDDGRHVPELLELLNGICDPHNTVACQIRKDLWVSTDKGNECFEKDMKEWIA